jgi:hypothetical protein
MNDGYRHMDDITLLSDAKSRSISPENPTGEKGKGAMDAEGVCAEASRDLGKGWKISPCICIEPGETRMLADIEGPGRILSMWFTGCLGRDYILRIYWNDQRYPSVEVPLADFFGYGWFDQQNKIKMEFSPIDSAMIAVNPCYGFNSYWPMPFQSHCTITMENRSETIAKLYYQINYELCCILSSSAYFHAQWRRSNPVPYAQEYVILDDVQGSGQYVGVILHVGNNGPNLWWGEGEVKFYIDGDEYPTICGTGTEDYFGGAWGWDVNGKYTAYTSAYMGVHQIHEPSGGEDIQQRFAMYRWHIPDPVRFSSDLKVTIQDLGWRRNGRYYLARQDDFSSVAYWYQTLPAVPFPPLPDRNAMETV